MPPRKQITAAGAVVLRPRAGKDPQLLLVHRPAYNDWTLPKGKLDPDEYLPAAAVRETLEETAVSVRLGIPVNMISYPVGGGQKTVYYWRAVVQGEGRHRPTSEIDRMAWLSVRTALARMTYADEKALVEQGLGLPDSTPLLLVRHGKAMERGNWTGRDQARQLNTRGRQQSAQLIPLLEAFGVGALASSTAVRCMKTLQPFARKKRLDLEGWATLTEEQAARNPKAVDILMKRLIKQTTESRVPLAICGHRPVLPLMLGALGVPDRLMQPGAAMVAHLGPKGDTVAIEWHKPRS